MTLGTVNAQALKERVYGWAHEHSSEVAGVMMQKWEDDLKEQGVRELLDELCRELQDGAQALAQYEQILQHVQVTYEQACREMDECLAGPWHGLRGKHARQGRTPRYRRATAYGRPALLPLSELANPSNTTSDRGGSYAAPQPSTGDTPYAYPQHLVVASGRVLARGRPGDAHVL